MLSENKRTVRFYNLKREKERLEAEGHGCSAQELAERLQAKEEDILDLDAYLSGEDISLDTPLNPGTRQTYVDHLSSPDPSPEEEMAQAEMERLLEERLQRFSQALSPRDRQVLKQRLLAETPRTLQELGKRFGVTRETIRLVEKRLLQGLQEDLTQGIPELFADLNGSSGPGRGPEERDGISPGSGPRLRRVTASARHGVGPVCGCGFGEDRRCKKKRGKTASSGQEKARRRNEKSQGQARRGAGLSQERKLLQPVP